MDGQTELLYQYRISVLTRNKKLSKLVHACRNYSLPKLAHFFDKQWLQQISYILF